MIENESPAHCADAYEAAFARRAGAFVLEPEVDSHRAILGQLFEACSPLAESLPPALLHLQASAQYDDHRAQHPEAMRRIVTFKEKLVGRIVLDWSGTGPMVVVDIAVFPEFRTGAIGLTMLRAATDVADAQRRACSLTVLRDNPAARLYARLGFVAVDDDEFAPFIDMERMPKPVAALPV